MMNRIFNSDKGIFLMSAGFVILLYSLGIISKEFILFLLAVGMIAVGFAEFGGVEKVKEMLKKK